MVQFLANLIVLQKYFEFIPLKKDRCRESYIARIFQYDCLISKSPDQAVAAVNLRKQRPSSVLASVSYPEATTIQLIVGDAVSSGRGNGKKSREPRTSETIILNDGSCASITVLCCFPCTELKLSQLHVTTPLRNAVNVLAFLHFKVRPGGLFSIPQKLMGNEQFRHEA